MKRLVALFLIFSGLHVTSASSGTFELHVGSCPSQISFQLVGNWEDAYLSESAADALKNNPARTAIVAGVFLTDHIPNASMSIMSLGSLDRAQGTLSEEQFWQLAELFEDQVRDPDPALLSKLNELLGKYAIGSRTKVPDYKLREYILTTSNRFVVLGTSSSSGQEFLTAALLHYSAACIVTVNIGIPEKFGLEALLDALHSVQIYSSALSD